MKELRTFVFIILIGWWMLCAFKHYFPDNEGMFNPDAQLNTSRIHNKENSMTAAGRVRVGDIAKINGYFYKITKIRWHAGKGVEFISFGATVGIVPFMDEVEVA